MGNFWSITPILKHKATYNIVYGQRGNGKTYGVCAKIVNEYLDTGTPSAYIRRLDEMIKPANIQLLFDPHLDLIKKRTNGEYNCMVNTESQVLALNRKLEAAGKAPMYILYPTDGVSIGGNFRHNSLMPSGIKALAISSHFSSTSGH